MSNKKIKSNEELMHYMLFQFPHKYVFKSTELERVPDLDPGFIPSEEGHFIVKISRLAGWSGEIQVETPLWSLHHRFIVW